MKKSYLNNLILESYAEILTELNEAPYQTTYIKVAKPDYKIAMRKLDKELDPTHVNMDIVDDDGDGNVIIYFNFTTAMTGHPHYNPDVDPAEFIYDLSMDLQANGINITSASHDIEEGMSDKEFADAQEADRLADHPERDKILAIQKLIAKEKGVKEDKYDDMVASDKDIPDGKRKGAAKALRMVDKGASYDKVKKYLKQERVVEVKNEFETADEWADDGRYYVQVEDNGKGGGWIIDPNHSNYTPGTKLILNTLDEQDYRFEDAEDYFLQVQRMEALKNEAEAEHLINRYGTDLVDELELHIEWHDVMFPEDIEDDDDDDVDESRYTKLRDYYKKIDQMNQQSKKDFEKNPGHGNVAEPSKQVDVNEESEIDKITKAKRLIKQQAPAMNKLPQDDPKRKSFIDRVKQINQKHKELLDNEDDKISGTGRDQELDEGRGDFDDVLKAVQNMSNNDDISEKEAALEIVYALANKFQIPVDKNLEDYMEEAVSEVKVGDVLSKDGLKGKIIKMSDTQATVDFGNGDVYGIAHSRIKGQEIDEGDGLWANIRAKRARGGKPAHKNSNAHKDAVKAGEKINKTNEYGGSQGARELETLFGALGYRDGFDDFIEDNPGAVEALHGWISSIPEFRKKLGAEFTNSELEDMGLYDIAGYDDDDEDNIDEYDIYHKQDWSDDPKEKEARKNNADRKKINKDTLDIDEAEARPIPDTILRGYNANVKNAQSMASALLSLFNQINDKESTDFKSNGNIKRVLSLLNTISKTKDTETDQAVKEIDTRAARASLDKFAAKEKELDRQNPNRHKEAGKKAAAARDAARAAKKKGGNSTAKHTSFYNKEGKINEGATCCGKCGRVHVKGNCKRPYLKGKAHCRNNK